MQHPPILYLLNDKNEHVNINRILSNKQHISNNNIPNITWKLINIQIQVHIFYMNKNNYHIRTLQAKSFKLTNSNLQPFIIGCTHKQRSHQQQQQPICVCGELTEWQWWQRLRIFHLAMHHHLYVHLFIRTPRSGTPEQETRRSSKAEQTFLFLFSSGF